MKEKKRRMNETTLIWNDLNISLVYGLINYDSRPGVEHTHSQYEMFVIKSCKGSIVVNGTSIPVSSDSVLIVAPGVNHIVNISEGDSVVGMTVRFDYKRNTQTKHDSVDKIFTIFNETMTPRNGYIFLKGKEFGSFCQNFIDESESHPELASALIKHMFEGLFLNIMRYASNKENYEKTSIFSYTSTALSNDVIISIKIDDYMLDSGCNLSWLAGEMKMSTRNVQRIIHNLYGKSFSARLTDIRISRALALFRDRSLSLSDIAQRVGYNRYDSFRKAFISKVGISPAEYRAECLNDEIENK